ncbi:Schizosaccharomyces specific protein [Schizosaccharomyces osmophilus]|uniref:Schizosaccharomyces specific protein n=1 Tax=Schizosaccharomyces osmophilus TaxID=2545709 RepID=A0AAF0AW09_9SCHI|nr:Schizosaccharomyces specific protein [Schizosaccharomyces osmophilus]WBW73008.1 Schizosaccharomyces specific protein [Schizosaccharomyces osmophilus]
MGYTAAFIQWGILLGGSYYLYQKITEKSKKPSNGKSELKSRRNLKVNKKKKKSSKATSKEEEFVKADESQKKVALGKPTSLSSETVKAESEKPSKAAYVSEKKEDTISNPPRKQQNAKGKENVSKKDDLQHEQNISSSPVASTKSEKQNEEPENIGYSRSSTPASLKLKETVKVMQTPSSDSRNNDDDSDDGFQIVSKSKNGRKSVSSSIPQTKKQRQNQQRKEKFRELQEIADLEQRKKLASHRNELEMNMKRSKVASPNRFSPSSFVAVGQAGSSSSTPRYDTLW